MTNVRKSISPEFKSKLAIQAVREQELITELASRNKVHPNQISLWKKQLLEGATSIFSRKNSGEEKRQQELEAELYRQIGQLKVELDWLKKKSGFLR